MENNRPFVDANERLAWNQLFGSKTEIEIAVIINTFWLDPAYKITVLKLGENVNLSDVSLKDNDNENKNNRNQSRHHRRPRSIGGKNGGNNAITVNRGDHNAWHKLFRNFMPDKIAEIINKKWLDPNSDYRFGIVRLADTKDDGDTNTFRCEICGKSYFNEIEVRKCRKKGWLAPRFARGERVLIKIKGFSPQMGTIVGWDDSFSINLHFNEIYTVEYGDENNNEKIGSINAERIKYVFKNNGRKERRKKCVVFSKRALRKAKKRKGFI